MKDNTIHTVEQIGARIRLKRKEKKLSQHAFAEQLGVERKWVLRLEAGNPKAELQLVLQALRALGLNIAFQEREPQSTAQPGKGSHSGTLSEVFRRVQRQSGK